MTPLHRVDYDRENDVLYVAFEDQRNSYGDDSSENIILRRDMDDEHITGLTILDFMEMIREDSPELQSLPVDIDFRRQILPFCS